MMSEEKKMKCIFMVGKGEYSYFEAVVYRTAKKTLGSKYLDWVDDLVQDSFLKAYHNQHQYNEKVSSVSAWLTTLTKNLCIDFMRMKKNDHYNRISIDNAFDIGEEDKSQLEQEEFCSSLQLSLSKLNERDRQLLVLRYFEDKSGREIAAFLNLQEKNINSYMMRAKANLRKRVEKNDSGIAA